LKIEPIEKSERKIKFILSETTPQFANALRRAATNEIPILAIDDVDIYENHSVFYDEVIAHRLALIPLKFNPDELNLPSECKCDGAGCILCQVLFSLEKKGPGTVYSKDIKFDNPNVSVLYPDIPIVELAESHSIKIQGIARLGFGTKHAKWQAAKAFYQYYPEIKVVGKIKNKNELTDVCPRKALSFSGEDANVSLACDLCGECVKASDGALKITSDGTKIIFTIESVSGLSASEVLLQALRRLKTYASDFMKALEKV